MNELHWAAVAYKFRWYLEGDATTVARRLAEHLLGQHSVEIQERL
ncbi:MAG: hypothetical protein JWM76_895 [Pseudonocardiales bacterium]|nr:hypothetical protein [Pseudonocardiales bacterium]